MSAEISTDDPLGWQQQADRYLLQGDYTKAASLYEQAIEAEPSVKFYYWHLGLILLLQGQEAEAQMIWLLAIAEGEPEQVESWTRDLTEVLQAEADRREAQRDYRVAWAIRQHIREVNPDDLDNLLHIIQLSPSLEISNHQDLPLSEVAHLLQSSQPIKFDANLRLQIIQQVLELYPLHPSAFEFIEACILNTDNDEGLIHILTDKAAAFVNSLSSEKTARFTKLCLQIAPNNIGILANLANLYQTAGRNLESVEFAQRILNSPHTLVDEVAANYLTVRGLMRAGGQWQKAEEAHQEYQRALSALIESNSPVNEGHLPSLMTTVVFPPYFQDDPDSTHKFRNVVGKYCQSGIQRYSNQGVGVIQSQQSSKRVSNSHKLLKIGYLSTCLRRHSVGWLARWVFQYHERDRFQVYAYSLEGKNDPIQDFIARNTSNFCDLSTAKTITEIAERIYQDEIDVLLDLDSITSSKVCGIMALKPAPVQATWLGSDASGLPAIDYFIADPYVLPESAQDYYASTIWRLPTTYIAVDGFEVEVPTLRRDQLNIPNDAVVYLSCQTAYKRHPNTARLQVKITKEVPKSYLLIKGQGDEESMKRFFEQIAEEEGVESERLRFLPDVGTEATHRANLGIADVVLDTYPYNGATTTLETLWVGIPIVTRVGEQFSARNSYTMMMNVGVTEGIAWTDEEYVEWGVRLGKDAVLRQQVAWKLKQSRQTAPLWNAKQFTHEMEKAYEQMWEKYIQGERR
ncbi:O-linked N-acetylglucosamine transferase, SPINDLY family protein [Coleofasciculus sp. FACHB-712]|uniref:O-linked N-acetylglucosamine transferase, SPINDLY family protein n=1 Tax=Coleofasciculus sp. FACHB-712 TaxID=2692789 RepID=UPI001682B925|nr:O-linked N-acetylglucosamine transferase, SPINDLY family protein [Coleofasciculus sp. FACHB-712]MBD1945810.1 O-linked N-acetylglucosamine transferase, SPINDLY family protein [Coleofasciculus sp. FACHB-712]